MKIDFDALEKEQRTLDLESDVSGIPELLEAGVVGTIKAHFEISTLEGDSRLFQAEVEGKLKVECGRCMDPLDRSFLVTFNVLAETRKERGLEWLEDEDLGVEDYRLAAGPDIDGVLLDPIIAEQVLLNYNLHPLPELDGFQRCTDCGLTPPAAGEPKKAGHEDPRWAKLKALKDRK